MKKNISGFTLIEILLGILIFSIVIIGGFQALSAVTLGKIKLIEKTTITKDAFYFSEKLFEEIKAGGTIDYEEYFNRKVVGTTLISSGHYSENTGFGNFGNNGTPGNSTYGNGFYYCRSTTTFMGRVGCYNKPTFNNISANLGSQRYGQYAFQFIDFNSNKNSDLGDEDGDLNIRGDDDDENLGEGPVVFSAGTNVKEIYLVSGDGKKRTFLRWNWKVDQNRPNNDNTKYPCSSTTFGSGCLGTIEILKLDGKDWGVNHKMTPPSTGSFDGIIDTWLIDKDFSSGNDIIAGTGNIDDYWQPLFGDNINVSDFKVYAYPNTNINYAWKDLSDSSNINPYLRLSITLEPSWKKRAGMKGSIPKINLNTTINLVDYFTK